MLEESRIAPVAKGQLAAWEKLAAGWEMTDWRTAGTLQFVRTCDRCRHGVILLTDTDGREYQYSDEQRLALVVLHLRNHHAELGPGG